MKKWFEGSLVGATLVILTVLACAPRAAPAPAKPTTLVPSPETAALPKAPTVTSPEQAAWAEVVEAAKKEGKLTIYSYSFTGDLGLALARAFKERYGIQMEVVAGSGAVFLERLKVEARHPVGDLLEGSAVNSILAKQEGLTQTFNYLPALKETGVWLFDPQIDPENHLVGYSPVIHSPWINTRLIKPGEEPRSWRDFLDSKWRKKILMLDPDSMPTPNFVYILLTRYSGFDNEYFRALNQQDLVMVPNQRENDSRLARGEAPLSFITSLSAVGPMVAEGAPIKPIDMKEGARGSRQTLNMTAKAPHPNSARVFMNWLLTSEGQTISAKIRSNLPLRTDVPDFTTPTAKIKYARIVPFTPKDDEDAARVQRERILSRLWGR